MRVLPVARHEFEVHVRRRSFLLTTALVPLLGGVMVLFASLAGVAGTTGAGASPLSGLSSVGASERVGLVDPGGFVVRQPAVVDDISVTVLHDEDAARAALASEELDAVYVLDGEYPSERIVVRLAQGLTPAGRDARAVQAMLRANIWPESEDSWLADAADPGRRVSYDLASGISPGATAELYRPVILPGLIAVLLYSTIFMLSSFLLQSVTTEKENRVIEILLTSARPFELLAGKVLGLGALGLVQLVVWSVSGALLTQGGTFAALRLSAQEAGPGTLSLAALYFLLGFLFYASLLAAIGALVPTFQESGPLTFAVLTPAWLPFLLVGQLLAYPNGPIAVLLSLLPPTAPLVMLIRVMSVPVPAWQVALSLTLLALSALVVLAAAARLFRASVLLAGAVPRPATVWRLLLSG
jgi:ABC-2 type transport system permease protein